MFPIIDWRGRVCGFTARKLGEVGNSPKYVNSSESACFKKGELLYGAHRAFPMMRRAGIGELILCEGQMDVLRCHQSGIFRTVATSGTALTQKQAKIIAKNAESVLLAYDGDVAGRKAIIKAGRLLLAECLPVRVVVLPDGEDPDSIIKELGVNAFQELVDKAITLARFQARWMLSDETRPYSLPVVHKVSRSVMSTIASCPSSVMRSMMLSDLALELKVPLDAVKEDFINYAKRSV